MRTKRELGEVVVINGEKVKAVEGMGTVDIPMCTGCHFHDGGTCGVLEHCSTEDNLVFVLEDTELIVFKSIEELHGLKNGFGAEIVVSKTCDEEGVVEFLEVVREKETIFCWTLDNANADDLKALGFKFELIELPTKEDVVEKYRFYEIEFRKGQDNYCVVSGDNGYRVDNYKAQDALGRKHYKKEIAEKIARELNGDV